MCVYWIEHVSQQSGVNLNDQQDTKRINVWRLSTWTGRLKFIFTPSVKLMCWINRIWDPVTQQWFTQEYSSSAHKNNSTLVIKAHFDPPPSLSSFPDCWLSIISLSGDGCVAAHSSSLCKQRADAGASLQGRRAVISRASLQWHSFGSMCPLRAPLISLSPSPRAVGGLGMTFLLSTHLSSFLFYPFSYLSL